MKILFVGTKRTLGAPQYSTVHVWEVLRGLRALGNEISLLDGPWLGDCLKSSKPRRHGAFQRLFDHLPGMLKVPALVLLQLRLVGVVLWRARMGTRDFDVVYGRHTLLPAAWLLGRMLSVPVVKEVNGLGGVELSVGQTALKGWPLTVLGWIERVGVPLADGFIAVSPELASLLVVQHGVDQSRVTTITNGANADLFVPRDRFAARARLGLSSEYSYVLFVGVLTAWQGVDALIRCVPQVVAHSPLTRFLVVGDGPERRRLEKMADEVGGAGAVQFVGAVAYETVPWYCAAADVCVMPKTPMATGYSPLKLHEYLACGRPVVATRLPSFHFLEDLGVGLLADANSDHALSVALLRILTDRPLATEMGLRGREYVVRNASWADVSERVAQVLEQAVSSTKRSQQRKNHRFRIVSGKHRGQ